MAIRIQLRRDTAANWTSSNPVLRAGELGIETDTLKFKIGNGSSTWTQITNYANVTTTGLSNSLSDYILAATKGTPGGPAALDSNGDLLIPENSVILWNDAEYDYTTTLTATQPTADRTITIPNATGTVALTSDLSPYAPLSGATFTGNISLPTQITFEGATADAYETVIAVTDPTSDRVIVFPDVTGNVVTTGDTGTVTNLMLAGSIANDKFSNSAITINGTSTSLGGSRTLGTDDVSEGSTNKYFTDERAQDAIATAIAAGTHTNITITYDDSTNKFTFVGANTYSDENAQDAIGNAVGTGLSYNDSTGAISVDTSTIQARVTDVSDTEIGYLNGVTSAIQTQINDKAPINNPTFTGTVTLAGSPTSDLHAATKAYVDAATSGLNVHASVKAATTADVSLNNSLEAGDVLDGVTLAHNDRVLVKNQDTTSQNGIYIVQPNGAATRATDYDSTPEVDAGDFIFVESGTVNGKTGWIQTNTIATIGTDPIEFSQFSGAGAYLAGNGLTLTGNSFSINTGTTADLSTAQTFTNKTLTSPKINEDVAVTATATELNILDGATLSTTELNYVDGVTSAIQTQLNAKAASADIAELAQDAVGTILSSDLAYNDSTPGIALNYVTVGNTLLDGVSGSSYGLIGTSTYLDVKNTNGYNKEIELDITAVKTQLNTDGYLTTSSTSTLTNKTLTSPKINEDVAVTATATELNYVDGVTSAIQTQLDGKVDESLFDAKGDLLVASADNTPAKLAVGTNGYLLTANSSATNGVEWAAAPVSLPSQSGESGKYLTTDGTTASWGTLVVPITTGTATVTANTATTVDTTALSGFTSIEYMVSLKQGSKVRTSKVVVQTDGTSVDMTEFAITETGGTIAGVVVSAAVASTNGVLQVTATDATTTNVTVKFSKVKL